MFVWLGKIRGAILFTFADDLGFAYVNLIRCLLATAREENIL